MERELRAGKRPARMRRYGTEHIIRIRRQAGEISLERLAERAGCGRPYAIARLFILETDGGDTVQLGDRAVERCFGGVRHCRLYGRNRGRDIDAGNRCGAFIVVIVALVAELIGRAVRAGRKRPVRPSLAVVRGILDIVDSGSDRDGRAADRHGRPGLLRLVDLPRQFEFCGRAVRPDAVLVQLRGGSVRPRVRRLEHTAVRPCVILGGGFRHTVPLRAGVDQPRHDGWQRGDGLVLLREYCRQRDVLRHGEGVRGAGRKQLSVRVLPFDKLVLRIVLRCRGQRRARADGILAILSKACDLAHARGGGGRGDGRFGDDGRPQRRFIVFVVRPANTVGLVCLDGDRAGLRHAAFTAELVDLVMRFVVRLCVGIALDRDPAVRDGIALAARGGVLRRLAHGQRAVRERKRIVVGRRTRKRQCSLRDGVVPDVGGLGRGRRQRAGQHVFRRVVVLEARDGIGQRRERTVVHADFIVRRNGQRRGIHRQLDLERHGGIVRRIGRREEYVILRRTAVRDGGLGGRLFPRERAGNGGVRRLVLHAAADRTCRERLTIGDGTRAERGIHDGGHLRYGQNAGIICNVIVGCHVGAAAVLDRRARNRQRAVGGRGVQRRRGRNGNSGQLVAGRKAVAADLHVSQRIGDSAVQLHALRLRLDRDGALSDIRRYAGGKRRDRIVARFRAAERNGGDIDGLVRPHVGVCKRARGGGDRDIITVHKAGDRRACHADRRVGRAVVDLVSGGRARDRDGLRVNRQRAAIQRKVVVGCRAARKRDGIGSRVVVLLIRAGGCRRGEARGSARGLAVLPAGVGDRIARRGVAVGDGLILRRGGERRLGDGKVLRCRRTTHRHAGCIGANICGIGRAVRNRRSGKASRRPSRGFCNSRRYGAAVVGLVACVERQRRAAYGAGAAAVAMCRDDVAAGAVSPTVGMQRKRICCRIEPHF